MESREPRGNKRSVRIWIIALFLAAACVATIAFFGYTPSRTKALTCPNAKVTLLDVTAIPGGSGHSGVVVRVSGNSSSPCTMSGYPIAIADLTNHRSATASDVREAFLGGFTSANAPLPRISLNSHPQIFSFTIQMASFGNPPNCPLIQTLRVTLPDSRIALSAHSMHESPMGLIQGFGFDCGNLQVTPLVSGSSGSGD